MCNAWNHSASCTCGFGGDTGSGGWSYTGNNSFTRSLESSISRSSQVSPTLEARTCETLCPWGCGARVFYHTNGNGDSVYFDSLGDPWEIHSCFKEYWKEARERRKLLGELSESQHITSSLLSEDEKQQRIIIGALQSLEGERTEKALANQLGIRVDELRKLYGHLYTVHEQI
jgi:hypothetical protein